MSYQVLARKWRPSNFSQVAGQAHVLKSLINALDNERLHHAYLFTGTRGVGKTTLARILAKCLNCETGVSSTPCGTCDSCREISEGRFIDLIEVDAASRTKVEDTRELLDNVQYTPTRGRFKVYLIDEVHMLSTHSFNALLKTLEEPPPHVKFLFATTDPQKLPITVLSRCLQFNLKNLSPQQITEYLITVLQEEKIEFTEDAIWQIAAAASGSMRDALTLVDQAISYCQGKIATDGVVEMLGIPEQQKVFALLEKMSAGDVGEVFALVQELAEHTPDYASTLDGLLSVLHRVALAQVVPDAIDNSIGDKAQVQKLAKSLTAEDVQLYYQMGIKGREDLRLAADSRSAFEMLLLRMLVFSPNYVPNPAAANTASTTEAAAQDEESPAVTDSANTQKKKTDGPEIGASIADSSPIAVNQQPEPPANAPKPTPASSDSVPEPVVQTKSENAARPAKASRSKAKAPTGENKGNQSVSGISKADKQPENAAETPAPENKPPALRELNNSVWLQCFKTLNLGGIAGNVLANSTLVEVVGKTIKFQLDQGQSAVFNDEIVPKLEQGLSAWLQADIHVEITIGEVTGETPAMLGQRLRHERHLEMVDEFENDENVQELLRHFSGTIAKDSIAPLND